MPTNRPTKRFLLPKDERPRQIVENIINDQSELWGISNSDAIIRDVLNSHLPTAEYPRVHAESVYAKDKSLLEDVASVLRDNVTGSIGAVANPNYRELVEFGLKLVRTKNLATALDTSHLDAHHFRSRFADVVERLNDKHETKEDYELERKVAYGRDLLVEADPQQFSRAPASAYIQYALEDFDHLGDWNSTCAYLADLFTILGDTEKKLNAKKSMLRIPNDTAALRSEWIRILASTTANWNAP